MGEESLALFWYDKEEDRHYPAGVAFFDGHFGEYRLKVDIHPQTAFYLKPFSVSDTKTYYRVEVVIKRGGKFQCRRLVGEGYSEKTGGGDIIMQLAPYKRLLVLGKGERA